VTAMTSVGHDIAAARAAAHRRLVAATTPGRELDCVTDLLRSLHALEDEDRGAVRRGEMAPAQFHARWSFRPCGARCPACC
jgi:hypothetical protein